jgi:hypothetical protein
VAVAFPQEGATVRRLVVGLGLLFVFAGCLGTSTVGQPSGEFPTTGDLIANFLAKYKLANSASLVYTGRCDNYQVVDRVPPRLHVSRTEDAGKALSEIFADDPEMQISRDPSGQVRMYESGVARDLLDHKFDRITILNGGTPRDFLRSPPEVMSEMLESPEVAEFMEARGMHAPGAPGSFRSLSVLTSGGPSMPDYLENVTLADALDKVVQVFHPGLWVYKECDDLPHIRRIVALEYQPLVPFRYFPMAGGIVGPSRNRVKIELDEP